MKINTKDLKNNIKLIVFEGHIDEHSIALVQDTFTEIFSLNICNIICNMEKVDHISAPVLKTFLEQISLARRHGGDLKLLHVQSSLQGIFRYAGFSDDLVFCNNLDTAIQQLSVKYESEGNEDFFSPTLQAYQSPLRNTPTNNVYEATIQMGSSPLQNRNQQQEGEDPFGATIQMSGSPLQNRALQQEGKDPYGATIELTESPLHNKASTQEKVVQPEILLQDEDQNQEELEKLAGALIKPPLQNENQNQEELEKFAGELIEPSLEKEDARETLHEVADKANKSVIESPKKPSPKPKKKRRKSVSPGAKGKKIPKQVSITKNEQQKIVVTELKRKSTIRFYRRMYPFCIFPLKVIFSQQKLQKIIHKKIEQVEGKQDVVVSKDKPVVVVVPHFPGCLIVPPEKKVDVTPEISHANFTVTPLAESKNQQGYVEIYYNGEMVDTIENMTYHVEKQTIAKFALYLSIISPVISTSLDVFQVDFNEKLPMAIESLSKFTQFFGGKTGFGFALAGVFLSISAVFYFLKRPREANPIENILPVN